MKRLHPYILSGIITVICLSVLEFSFALLTTIYRVYTTAQEAKMATPLTSVEDHPVWKREAYLLGRLKPTKDKKHNISGFPVSVNSDGFRGREIRKEGKKIVSLGDSVTFGWSSSQDEMTYPGQLQTLLGDEYEVINAGMPRWTSMDLLDLYVVKVAPLKPEVVLLMMGWNDIAFQHIPPYEIQRVNKNLSSVVADSLAIGRIVRRLFAPPEQRNLAGVNLVAEDEQILKEAENRPDIIYWNSLDEYERILRSQVQLIRTNGSTPILIPLAHFLSSNMSLEEKKTLLPHLKQFKNLSYQGWLKLVEETNRRIERVAKDMKVPLVEHKKKIPYSYFTDVCHLDDNGNKILAENVAATLVPILKGK